MSETGPVSLCIDRDGSVDVLEGGCWSDHHEIGSYEAERIMATLPTALEHYRAGTPWTSEGSDE